jgi:hypothetical protein
MLLSSRSLPLGNDPVPLAGFFASLSVTVFEIQEYDYAFRTNDHAGGCGRDSRNHNFSGPRNDLRTGAKRRGNARDWERPTV